MSRGIILILPYISRRAGVLDPNLMNNPYCRYPFHWNLSILLALRNSSSPPPSVHPSPELVLQRLNEIYSIRPEHKTDMSHWDYSCNTEWNEECTTCISPSSLSPYSTCILLYIDFFAVMQTLWIFLIDLPKSDTK